MVSVDVKPKVVVVFFLFRAPGVEEISLYAKLQNIWKLLKRLTQDFLQRVQNYFQNFVVIMESNQLKETDSVYTFSAMKGTFYRRWLTKTAIARLSGFGPVVREAAGMQSCRTDNGFVGWVCIAWWLRAVAPLHALVVAPLSAVKKWYYYSVITGLVIITFPSTNIIVMGIESWAKYFFEVRSPR